ncbi:GntR family transcriptional regulator [Actinomadura hibisca]|uniref:GntR family transcriptional regulator n=1 Tax=Actinomadura hibisca TaxID=68565 RepID=UPI000835F608|nr:GntR family transcriptional regulator [Actinomadura hibisca]
MAGLSANDIAAVLRDRILRENSPHPRGSVFPSQRTLAAEFSVSDSTINRALQGLRRQGLISLGQGRKTKVTYMAQITRDARDRYTETKRVEDRGGFAAEVRRQGMTPRSEASVRREVPPSRIADLLGIDPNVEVLVRDRDMYADDILVQKAPSYIPGDIAFGTQLEDLTQPTGGMLTRMKELGHEEVYADEYLTLSRPPTGKEQEYFALQDDQPVFELYHVAYDANGRAVEVSWHRGPVHLWGEFIYRVQIKQQ